MKKKILLLGASGMAGHVIYYYLKETGRYNITNVVFRHKLNSDSVVIDINDKNLVESFISKQQPDIIINCIGILIKGSQEHPDNAIFINAYFPHLLNRLSEDVGAKLIHISTDCVFSGKKGTYTECDFRDADDLYGRSKALGEITNGKSLTIRTSIIGPELKQDGEGLFHWFMNQQGEINGYTEAYWGGVTTLELAKAIDNVIIDNISGLVHLTNGEKISKFELLKLIKQIWNKDDVRIKPCDGKSIDKSLLPSNSIKYFVPSYKTMLLELKEWMFKNESLYRIFYLS